MKERIVRFTAMIKRRKYICVFAHGFLQKYRNLQWNLPSLLPSFARLSCVFLFMYFHKIEFMKFQPNHQIFYLVHRILIRTLNQSSQCQTITMLFRTAQRHIEIFHCIHCTQNFELSASCLLSGW